MVARTSFDETTGRWQVSTEPIESFATEDDAISFYLKNCDRSLELLPAPANEEISFLPFFQTDFQNFDGELVAGTWFDEAKSGWRISTVPIEVFVSEADAIAFYLAKCDRSTGLLLVPR